MERETVSIDFDGVIHEYSRAGYGPMGGIDVSLIREAHDNGFAVTVMTARDLQSVVRVLRRHGIWAFRHTPLMRGHGLPGRWYGGKSGRVVLVTHRKMAATAYIDDRAVPYRYGHATEPVWDTVRRLSTARRTARCGG